MRSHRFRRMVLVLACSSSAGCLVVSGCGGDGDSSLTGPSPEAGVDSSPDVDDTDGGGGESCGNQVVEGFEECDDANGMNGDGCESDCSFSCVAG